MKEFLSRSGQPFTVKVVDDDFDAYSELIARGFRTVPVTFIGARAVKGFDERALRDALTAAGS